MAEKLSLAQMKMIDLIITRKKECVVKGGMATVDFYPRYHVGVLKESEGFYIKITRRGRTFMGSDKLNKHTVKSLIKKGILEELTGKHTYDLRISKLIDDYGYKNKGYL